MRIITGGIGGMFQINRTRRISLRFHTSQETIFLRCIYIINKSLLALEIKLNRVGIVGITSYLEDWLSLDAFISRRIGSTHCLHIALVEIHGDTIRRKIHVLVLHIRITKEMRYLVMSIIDQRVVCLITDWRINTTRLLTVDTILMDTVIHYLIMFPYSLLQRVHLGGIGLRTDDFIAERIDKDGVAHSHGSRIHLSLLVFLFRRHTRVCNHHGSDGCKHQNSYS